MLSQRLLSAHRCRAVERRCSSRADIPPPSSPRRNRPCINNTVTRDDVGPGLLDYSILGQVWPGYGAYLGNTELTTDIVDFTGPMSAYVTIY